MSNRKKFQTVSWKPKYLIGETTKMLKEPIIYRVTNDAFNSNYYVELKLYV